jgi:hypothetical protein
LTRSEEACWDDRRVPPFQRTRVPHHASATSGRVGRHDDDDDDKEDATDDDTDDDTEPTVVPAIQRRLDTPRAVEVIAC